MKLTVKSNKEITGVPLRRALLLVLGWWVFSAAEAQVPTAPDNFYIVRHDRQNELNWSANPGAENVSNYTVYRSLDKVNFVNLTTVTATPAPQYIDNNVKNGVTYFYHITATNASGESGPSLVDASVPGSDFGKFIEFNGLALKDSLTILNSDELQLFNQSFTIELWLRIKKLPLSANEAHLVSRYRTNGSPQFEAFCLRLLNSGQLEFRTFGGQPSSTKRTTEVLRENEWYHVAVSYENVAGPVVSTNDVAIYINGALTTNAVGTSAQLIDPPESAGGKLVIGGDAVPSPNFFEGYMSELRIWSVARTASEITNNRCTMFRGDEAGIIGLWRFDEEGASTPVVYDYSPNGNNGGENTRITDFKPEAVDDLGSTIENSSRYINIRDNDANFSTKPVIVNLLSGYPLSGSATLINNDSTVSYAPGPGFIGIDTVKYVLSDTAVFCNSLPKTDTATVLVRVACSSKDTIDWNDRQAAQHIDKLRLIKKGLLINFRTDDPDNIQTGFMNEDVFQGINSAVWKQDATTNTQAASTWISFNRPVDQFCLDLLDIDSNPGGFTDSVIVNAYRGGNRVDLMPVNFTAGTAVDFNSHNSFTGNAPVDDAVGTDGNVSICYFVPVDSVQVIFTNAQNAPANPAEQRLGIGNFIWCAFPNNHPSITDEAGMEVDSLYFTIAPDSLLNVCLNVIDVDLDSLFISSLGPLSEGGTADLVNPSETCIAYNAAAGFTGVETFRVMVCDNRPNQLCDEVVIVINTQATPSLPPPTPPPVDLPEEQAIFVSEALSPNGDRILDHWEIAGIEAYPNSVVKVFNIWGDLIFQQTGYNNHSKAWLGQTTGGNRIGGSLAPDGTYFYVIDLGNRQPALKGYVVLKR